MSAGLGAKIFGRGFESNDADDDDARISLARIGIGIGVGVGWTTGASKLWIGWKLSIWFGTRVVRKMLVDPGDLTRDELWDPGGGKLTRPDGGLVGPKDCASSGTASGVRMMGVTVECTTGIPKDGGDPNDASGSLWTTTGSGAKVSDSEGE